MEARRLEKGPGLELGVWRTGCCTGKKHRMKGKSKMKDKLRLLTAIPSTGRETNWQRSWKNRLKKGGYRAEKQ